MGGSGFEQNVIVGCNKKNVGFFLLVEKSLGYLQAVFFLNGNLSGKAPVDIAVFGLGFQGVLLAFRPIERDRAIFAPNLNWSCKWQGVENNVSVRLEEGGF